MWWITPLFMILAGIFNSCMDVLRYRYKVSIFNDWNKQDWVNPSLSQKNKWESKSKFGDLIMSTILVWVTDMWHFSKMLMLTSIMFGIVYYIPITLYWGLDMIIFFSCFTSVFELFFSKILIKNN